MSRQPKHRYTLEEYVELELSSEVKYEYWDGQVFAMSGASDAHDQIQGNLYLLRLKLRGRKCRIFLSDMRLKVPAFPPYRYPDLAALCGEAVFEQFLGVDILTNPALIIEILSPSTEAFDRGDKFAYYKSINSFSEYLLVAQQRPHVVHYIKQANGDWLQREYDQLTDSVSLVTLDCAITLGEIYEEVTFLAGNPYRLNENP